MTNGADRTGISYATRGKLIYFRIQWPVAGAGVGAAVGAALRSHGGAAAGAGCLVIESHFFGVRQDDPHGLREQQNTSH